MLWMCISVYPAYDWDVVIAIEVQFARCLCVFKKEGIQGTLRIQKHIKLIVAQLMSF